MSAQQQRQHRQTNQGGNVVALDDVGAVEADMVRRNEYPTPTTGAVTDQGEQQAQTQRVDGDPQVLPTQSKLEIGASTTAEPSSFINPTNVQITEQIIVPATQRDIERKQVFDESIVARPLVSKEEPVQLLEWEKTLNVYSSVQPVTTGDQLIVYQPHDPVLDYAPDVRLFEPKMQILNESLTVFRPNTPLVTKEYSSNVLRECGVDSVNGTLFSVGDGELMPIITRGTGAIGNRNRYSNIEGELKMMLCIAVRNHVRVHDNATVVPPELRANLPIFDSDQVILPVGPALPLAAPGLQIAAINEYATEVYDGQRGEYHLGRVDPVRDRVRHMKVGHTENSNIDKFTAELLNINYVNYMNQRVDPHKLRDSILACSWEGSSVDIPTDFEFTPFEDTPRSVQLSALCLLFARLPNIQDTLLNMAMTYLMECGLMELTTTPNFIAPSVSNRASISVLRSGLMSIYGAGNLSDVYRLLAGEIVPWIKIGKFVPLMLDTDTPTSVITIFLYMAMQVLLPNQFWMYCRQIHNELVKYFTAVYPREMGTLLATYGYRRVRNNAGNWVNSPTNSMPFPHDSIFSDDIPMLFTTEWRNDGRLVILRQYMELFDPLGNNTIQDDAAREAEFPRLLANPVHICGIVPFQQRDALLLRIRSASEFMKSRATKNTWRNLASAEGTGYTEQLSHMTTLLCDTVEALCATAYYPMQCLANLPTSIFPNMMQPLNTPINTNWAIFSQGAYHGRAEMLRQYDDSTSWQASSFVMLFSNTNFSYNVTKGKGLDKVPLPSTVTMPDPVVTYSKQIILIHAGRYMSAPDALVEMILNRDNVSPLVAGLRAEWELANSSRITRQLTDICQKLFKVAPEWLKGFTPLTRDVRHDGRLSNPLVRRSNRAAEQLAFDALIDHIDIEGVLTFFTDVELERIDLAITMINQMRFIRTGVRLANQNRVTPTHQPILIPANYVEVEYVPNVTFVVRRIEGHNMTAYVTAAGNLEFDPANWGLVHLVVNAPIISSIDIAAIEAAIRDAKWIVTLKYVKYVPQLVSKTIPSTPSVADLCSQNEVELRVIPFFFNNIIPEASRFARPTPGVVQRIFPLENVIDKHVVSGLASTSVEDEDVHLILPPFSEYDTGTVDVNGYVRYTDGTLKRSTRNVSMSNPVCGVHKPMRPGVTSLPITVRPRHLPIE